MPLAIESSLQSLNKSFLIKEEKNIAFKKENDLELLILMPPPPPPKCWNRRAGDRTLGLKHAR